MQNPWPCQSQPKTPDFKLDGQHTCFISHTDALSKSRQPAPYAHNLALYSSSPFGKGRAWTEIIAQRLCTIISVRANWSHCARRPSALCGCLDIAKNKCCADPRTHANFYLAILKYVRVWDTRCGHITRASYTYGRRTAAVDGSIQEAFLAKSTSCIAR